MFSLVFLVMFGPKKGSVTSYVGSWDFKFNIQFISFLYSKVNAFVISGGLINFRPTVLRFLASRFQFTAITSRSTSYLLLLFWLFFFHFGETLLLIVFNYSVTLDSINSSSFMLIKQHIPNSLNSTSNKLMSQINFFIFFLTPLAFSYLTCLGYQTKYNFFSYSEFSGRVIIVSVTLLLFSVTNFPPYVLPLLVFMYLTLSVVTFRDTSDGVYYLPRYFYRSYLSNYLDLLRADITPYKSY
jgi:hypothetical protein